MGQDQQRFLQAGRDLLAWLKDIKKKFGNADFLDWKNAYNEFAS